MHALLARTAAVTGTVGAAALLVLAGSGVEKEGTAVQAAPCILDLHCDWEGRVTDWGSGVVSSSTT